MNKSLLLLLVLVFTGCQPSQQLTEKPVEAVKLVEAEPVNNLIKVAENRETIVYIADSGNKYHKKTCRYLKTVNEIKLENAKSSGYEACKTCKP